MNSHNSTNLTTPPGLQTRTVNVMMCALAGIEFITEDRKGGTSLLWMEGNRVDCLENHEQRIVGLQLDEHFAAAENLLHMECISRATFNWNGLTVFVVDCRFIAISHRVLSRTCWL